MISDRELQSSIDEFDALFDDGPRLWTGEEEAAVSKEADERRINNIIEQAAHDAVIKETTTFFFSSFTSVIAEFAKTLLSPFSRKKPSEDALDKTDQ